MVDKWIVFGGWALRPEILRPIFGPHALLIDTNEIMPHLVKNGLLAGNWQEILADRIHPLVFEKPWGIAGWSTGTILAYACAARLRPSGGVFIASTPSFCRRQGFHCGWKPAALKAMRNELAVDPRKVLTGIYEQCGPGSSDFGPQVPSELIRERLSAGLFFLEQATLLPVKKLSFPALFLHGKNDTIISSAAGKYFSDKAGGTYIVHEGPHAFFLNQNHDISESIKRLSLKTSV